MLSSVNTKDITQNSLFDEGLRIAQQFGLSDFAEELQQLKGDNSSEDLTASKDGDNNSLNQSVDSDNAEKVSEKPMPQISRDSPIPQGKLLEKVKVKEEIHVNGN